MQKLFALVRSRLDEAMTYGSFRESRTIAVEGVDLAHRREDLAQLAYFKGQVLMLRGQFDEALVNLDRAIRLDPFDGAAYNDRALCMVELGQGIQALTYFDRGIAAEPDYATVYHNKGWLLNRLGDPERAILSLKIALHLDPHRAVTFENMAAAYVRLGRSADAIDAYRRAVELLKPGHDDIKRQLVAKMRRLERRISEGPAP